jgi:hypothetical protein
MRSIGIDIPPPINQFFDHPRRIQKNEITRRNLQVEYLAILFRPIDELSLGEQAHVDIERVPYDGPSFRAGGEMPATRIIEEEAVHEERDEGGEADKDGDGDGSQVNRTHDRGRRHLVSPSGLFRRTAARVINRAGEPLAARNCAIRLLPHFRGVGRRG